MFKRSASSWTRLSSSFEGGSAMGCVRERASTNTAQQHSKLPRCWRGRGRERASGRTSVFCAPTKSLARSCSAGLSKPRLLGGLRKYCIRPLDQHAFLGERGKGETHLVVEVVDGTVRCADRVLLSRGLGVEALGVFVVRGHASWRCGGCEDEGRVSCARV